MVFAPPLQSVVDRYAKSLAAPSGLVKLYPREAGRPRQEHMALSPAVVLTSTSAFEGFAEELIAVTGAHLGLSFAQIARLAHSNAPTVASLEATLSKQLNLYSTPDFRNSFGLEIFRAPAVGASWWRTHEIGWVALASQSEGWIQVRHALSHGLTRGYLSEMWPTPMKPNTPDASSVLREQTSGKHSLTLHGALTCARIFRYGAEALCTAAARGLGLKPPRWRAVPEFPLETISD